MSDDFLKNIWEKQEDEVSFSQIEIFKMLSRKSLNNVKLILFINGSEILLGIGMFLDLLFNRERYLGMLNEKYIYDPLILEKYFQSLNYIIPLGLLFSFLFLFLFIKAYKALNAKETISEFIEKLIYFRNISYYYIGVSALFCVLIILYVLYGFLGGRIDMMENPFKVILIYGGICFFMLLIIAVPYYYLLYGVLLGKINKNLKILKELD